MESVVCLSASRTHACAHQTRAWTHAGAIPTADNHFPRLGRAVKSPLHLWIGFALLNDAVPPVFILPAENALLEEEVDVVFASLCVPADVIVVDPFIDLSSVMSQFMIDDIYEVGVNYGGMYRLPFADFDCLLIVVIKSLGLLFVFLLLLLLPLLLLALGFFVG